MIRQYLYCDRCNDVTPIAGPGQRPNDDQAQGWRRIMEQDICPSCWALFVKFMSKESYEKAP